MQFSDVRLDEFKPYVRDPADRIYEAPGWVTST